VRQERYSFPLFFAVDHHTRISLLTWLVSADRPARPGLIAGEHLFAQTALTFNYLRRRLERGELQLPRACAAVSSFGQQARRENQAAFASGALNLNENSSLRILR